MFVWIGRCHLIYTMNKMAENDKSNSPFYWLDHMGICKIDRNDETYSMSYHVELKL